MSNKAKRQALAAGLALPALSAFSSVSQAAVDAAITTAISTATTDGSAIGAAVLGFIIAISVFKHMRRAT